MEHRPHNIYLPLFMLMVTCASLTIFLPSAVSMNASGPSEILDGFNSEKNVFRISELLETSPGGDFSIKNISPNEFQDLYKNESIVTNDSFDEHTGKNKKSSLPLKTAAIIGSSSAVAAAFLAVGGGK